MSYKQEMLTPEWVLESYYPLKGKIPPSFVRRDADGRSWHTWRRHLNSDDTLVVPWSLEDCINTWNQCLHMTRGDSEETQIYNVRTGEIISCAILEK